MTTTRTATPGTDTAPPPTARHVRIYAGLIGVASVFVLLQGLWAGLFLRNEGMRDSGPWLEIHSLGGEAAILFALVATVFAFVTLRKVRKDLALGAGVLAVLLITESYLGGRIVDNGNDALTAVHVPLAMALMGLVIALPLRARRG